MSISKKPSAELLQAVADIFGLTVKNLFTIPTASYPSLIPEDLDLLKKVSEQVINEIKAQQLNVSWMLPQLSMKCLIILLNLNYSTLRFRIACRIHL